MDAPFVPRRRLAQSSRHPAMVEAGQRYGGSGGGGDGGSSGGEIEGSWERGGKMRKATRAHRVAAAALEAYVRARLSAIRGNGDGGGDSRDVDGGDGGSGDGGGLTSVREKGESGGGGTLCDEVGELMAILTSFRRRQSVEEAEGKARALLPPGVDLERFAGDADYRQVRRGGCLGWPCTGGR